MLGATPKDLSSTLNSNGRRKELTPTSCPVPSICTQPHTHTQRDTLINRARDLALQLRVLAALAEDSGSQHLKADHKLGNSSSRGI